MNNSREQSLTIVALARNETEHLRPCFRSLKLLIESTKAETLIIFDSRGANETLDVARALADHVVIAGFEGFANQRNRALDIANTRWLFFIDADERCTLALASEISHVLKQGTCAAYRVPRRNIFFGREVRHTGWSPDYQIRLLQRDFCRYDLARQVHEVPIVHGKIGTLRARLVHYNYATWGQFIAKQRAYSDLEVQSLFRSGKQVGLKNVIGQPVRELRRRLVDYKGYRDGPLGFALSAAMGIYVLRTYIQLWRMQRINRGSQTRDEH